MAPASTAGCSLQHTHLILLQHGALPPHEGYSNRQEDYSKRMQDARAIAGHEGYNNQDKGYGEPKQDARAVAGVQLHAALFEPGPLLFAHPEAALCKASPGWPCSGDARQPVTAGCLAVCDSGSWMQLGGTACCQWLAEQGSGPLGST